VPGERIRQPDQLYVISVIALDADRAGSGRGRRQSLRCAFEHYRAMPATARQISDLAAQTRLRVPTLAIGARTVGDALHRQLTPIADDLRGAIMPDCGHIIPLDRPDQATMLLTSFLAGR
jgi:pimeloyl-ACP methyl ester carboxylesterase